MAIVSRKSKKGLRYQVKLQDALGKWHPTKTFRTKADAEKYQRNLHQLNEQGHFAQSNLMRNITMSEYWNIWTINYRQKTSEGWKLSQDQMWRDHISPFLGSSKFINVTPRHIQSLLITLREKQNLSDQTRLHVYNLLHKMFQDAIEEEPPLLNRNPVRKKFKPEVKVSERNHLSPDEAKRLLKHARDDYYGLAIWLSVLLGLRSEAIMALRVKHVDFKKNQILISDCYKRKIGKIMPYPKGKQADYIPIPPIFTEYLKQRLAGKMADDFVVSGKRNAMVSYNALLDNFRRLCHEAGVPQITTHEGRHSASELWIEEGASKEDIGRLLMQKCASTTNRYIHQSERRLTELAQHVGSDIDSLQTVSEALAVVDNVISFPKVARYER